MLFLRRTTYAWSCRSVSSRKSGKEQNYESARMGTRKDEFPCTKHWRGSSCAAYSFASKNQLPSKPAEPQVKKEPMDEIMVVDHDGLPPSIQLILDSELDRSPGKESQNQASCCFHSRNEGSQPSRTRVLNDDIGGTVDLANLLGMVPIPR